MNSKLKDVPCEATDPATVERQEIWQEYRAAKLIVATQMLWKISDIIEELGKDQICSHEMLANCIKTLGEVS